jgi:hypothetical protein
VVGRHESAGPLSGASRLTPSTLPVGDSTDFGKDYSQTNATLDLCVNMLVRPTRISPRQSGPQGRVVPFGGARRGPDRRLRILQSSSADRAESLGL